MRRWIECSKCQGQMYLYEYYDHEAVYECINCGKAIYQTPVAQFTPVASSLIYVDPRFRARQKVR